MKREFLYDEDKLIPIQLLRTNYGLADTTQTNDVGEVLSKQVEIEFPNDSSDVVMVLSDNMLTEVRSTTPESNIVSVTIEEGNAYTMYVISKEYDDGFIRSDLTVDGETKTGERFQFEYDTTPARVDLSIDGAMVRSQGRDETDDTQWYGYDGFYPHERLIWSSPEITPPTNEVDMDGEILYAKRGILENIDAKFKQYDIVSFNDESKEDPVKMYKLLDDVASYMKTNRQNIDGNFGGDADQLNDVWSFLNSSIPGYNGESDYYLIYDDKVSDKIDELGVYTDFMLWDKFDTTENSQRVYGGGVVSATNAGRNHPTNREVGDNVATLNLMELDAEERYTGQFSGGNEGRNKIHEIWDKVPYASQWWHTPSSTWYEPYITAWAEFQTDKSEFIKETNESLGDYGIVFHPYTNTKEDNRKWWSDLGEKSKDEYQNLYGWVQSKISEVEFDIDEYENRPVDEPIVSGYQQAQEAILQNIRFVKDLVNSIDDNLWASYNSTSAIMLASLIDIKNQLKNKKDTNTIMNITNSTVRNADVEVVWKRVGDTDWQPLSTTIDDVGENVKMINLSTSDFKTIGKYIVAVRPKITRVDVYGVSDGFLWVRDDLNEFKTANALYGYNAQIYSADEYDQGTQKIVVESKWRASGQYIKLSPIINESEVGEDAKLDLWSNDFIPVLIEVDVVEHNALTLSYSLYGKKEMYTDTGLCIIYDHNGDEYKRLSFGKVSNAGTGNSIVEYRTPEE